MEEDAILDYYKKLAQMEGETFALGANYYSDMSPEFINANGKYRAAVIEEMKRIKSKADEAFRAEQVKRIKGE